MEEFKGTPGPWEWWTSNSFLRLSSKTTGKDGGVVDSMVMRDGHPTLLVKKGDMALISSAPELLEAIQKLRDYAEDVCGVCPDDCHEEHPLMMASSAIAKALGKE